MDKHENLVAPLHPTGTRSLPIGRGVGQGGEGRQAGITLRIVRHGIETLSPAALAESVAPLVRHLDDYGMLGTVPAHVETILAQEKVINWGAQGTSIEITRS